jgi:Fe-S-cluster containining protein
MRSGSEQKRTERREGLRPLTGGKFRFLCHKGVTCFTQCCADLHLLLTPYDIIRIKNRLRLPAEEFIKTYTMPDTEGASPFPMLKLRMEESGRRRCPFVTEQGCTIYEDRPGACRLYPIGSAAYMGKVEEQAAEHHFIVDESHCLGFNEETEWSVEEWVENQGFDVYTEMNRPWMEIVASQNPRKRQLNQEKLQMFYMVSYNLDRFRDFVFQTKFLRVFRLSAGEVERISTSETELMKLGMKWLGFALFGETTLTLPHPSL